MDKIKCYMDPSVPQDSDCAYCCIYCKEKNYCDYTCPIVKQSYTERDILNSKCEYVRKEKNYDSKRINTLLWQLLEPHIGHQIEIVKYGNANISVEDMDTNEVIFDTDLYELVGLEGR